ncbi:hypothetical protein AADZ90_021575 [Aestuariibius sp. 2305UL40-4]|uniref:hypothetical protein n=1 Tax=Aestuariibius violaceus TaxID=3234132 RepID=UPI00345E2519
MAYDWETAMHLPSVFASDASSHWAVSAISALSAKVSWQEQRMADANMLLVETRCDAAARAVVIACTKEPWVTPVTKVETPISISALYALDIAAQLPYGHTSIDAIFLIDRDSERSRTGVLEMAQRRAELSNGGRIIVIAAGLTKGGGIFGSEASLKAVDNIYQEAPRYNESHDALDPDVKVALQYSSVPFLIIDPWNGDRGQWLPVHDFVSSFC